MAHFMHEAWGMQAQTHASTHLKLQRHAIQHTSYIKEMSFRWASYLTSQQLKKKLPKENTVLNFIVCFTHLKALLFFSETNKKTSHKWLNMQLQ